MYAQLLNSRDRVLWPSAAVLALGAAVFLGVLALKNTTNPWHLVADDGPVQTSTFIVLAVTSAYAAKLSWRHAENRLNFALLAMIFALYGCRELDLHRPAFLAEHFTRLDFYVSTDIPLWQKLVFGTVIVVSAVTFATFTIRMAAPFVRSAMRVEPWALFAILWFAALVAAQASDKSDFNETYGGQAFEEIMETVAACFGLLAVVHFPRSRPTKNATAN